MFAASRGGPPGLGRARLLQLPDGDRACGLGNGWHELDGDGPAQRRVRAVQEGFTLGLAGAVPDDREWRTLDDEEEEQAAQEEEARREERRRRRAEDRPRLLTHI